MPPAVLPRRDRLTLRAIRGLAAVTTLVALVLLPLPFLVPSAVGELTGVYGAGALAFLGFILPWWVFPLAVHQPRSLQRDGDLLTIQTLMGSCTLDLAKVTRVWARKFIGRGSDVVLVGLAGPDIPSAWLTWDEQYGSEQRRQRGLALVRDVARRPGVVVSARARVALGFPDAPRGWARSQLALRGIVFYLATVGVFCAVLVGYIWVTVWVTVQ